MTDYDDYDDDHEDDGDFVVTLDVNPHSALGIVAQYHETERRHRAAQEVNARSAAKAPAEPPGDVRELTFAEVAGGEYPDNGTWMWPEPVFVALGDSYDLGGEFVADAALMLRGFATLYANGYRLVGPPPKADRG